MKKILLTSILAMSTTVVLAQGSFSNYIFEINRKIEVISSFKDASVPNYFINCGNSDINVLRKYSTHRASGFDIGFYDRRKDEVNKGGNILISIIKKRFFELQSNYSNQYKELLGADYANIVERLQNGEKFYIHQQGKLNKLILCGQEEGDIATLASDVFSATFPTETIDTDKDGLPDFFEKLMGTDIHKKDTDGDGLSDYDEYFKYHTNPNSKDSDNDGIPDGDWNERREYAYSIYAKREIYAPFDTCMMNDLFQDSKVVKVSKDTLIHETILYPNTINFVIPTAANKSLGAEATEYTQPSFFCNYTPEMKKELRAITSTWNVKSNYELLNSFAEYAVVISALYPSMEPLNFYINVANNKVNIVHKERFNDFKTSHFTSNESVLEHLTFGASMYKNRMRGACGSSSIYYNTLLRALNFPTRIVVSNPILDFTDQKQVQLINNLKNEQYRNIALSKTNELRGYANHFFYEVNINNRWIRCDYDNVNLSCVHVQGIFIVQNKIKDFSDEDYATTWGTRMVKNQGNVYKTLDLSDQFPVHKPQSALTQ